MSEAQTVLIVEDSETDRLIVRLFLEQAGYRVLEADSAESGLELCSRTRPDLLLIDGLLPFMDGFQMTRALRAIPEYRDTPLLILSGLEEPEWPARALDAGATGFILKSNDWDGLVARIRQYLAP
ncbi:MAG: response regulator [Rhodocyclales bacterium]|nr:response regulator [Rhodocyclales bacterium]